MNLTQLQAEEVWRMLVETCGASQHEDDMACFVCYAQEDDPLEYRFQGNLGFGGKLYFHVAVAGSPLRVACYPEDETPDRKRMVDNANESLIAFSKIWGNTAAQN